MIVKTNILYIISVLWFMLVNSAWAQQANMLVVLDSIPLKQVYQEMEIDGEGNIYLLDTQNNIIAKFFASTQYDSVFSIGGKSARKEGFMHLTHLSIKNRQSLYVLDEAARRVSMLNTNLKVTEQMDFLSANTANDNTTDIQPIGFDVSNAGELFVLNGWDNKVYKYNAFGPTEVIFGGVDAGEGNLQNPDCVWVGDDNLVWISDTVNALCKVFDLYGIYQTTYTTPKTEKWQVFHVANNVFWVITRKGLWGTQIKTQKNIFIDFPSSHENEHYIDFAVWGDNLFVLKEKKILHFKWK